MALFENKNYCFLGILVSIISRLLCRELNLDNWSLFRLLTYQWTSLAIILSFSKATDDSKHVSYPKKSPKTEQIS